MKIWAKASCYVCINNKVSLHVGLLAALGHVHVLHVPCLRILEYWVMSRNSLKPLILAARDVATAQYQFRVRQRQRAIGSARRVGGGRGEVEEDEGQEEDDRAAHLVQPDPDHDHHAVEVVEDDTDQEEEDPPLQGRGEVLTGGCGWRQFRRGRYQLDRQLWQRQGRRVLSKQQGGNRGG